MYRLSELSIEPTIDNFVSINGQDYRSYTDKVNFKMDEWWNLFDLHFEDGTLNEYTTTEWDTVKTRTYFTINIRKGKIELYYKMNSTHENGNYFTLINLVKNFA